MRSATVDLRGERVDVQYRDSGYEEDTNAHEIDWNLVDVALENTLTDDERQSVEAQIRQISWDDVFDGDWDL